MGRPKIAMKLGGGYWQVTKGYRKRALTRIFYDSTTTDNFVLSLRAADFA